MTQLDTLLEGLRGCCPSKEVGIVKEDQQFIVVVREIGTAYVYHTGWTGSDVFTADIAAYVQCVKEAAELLAEYAPAVARASETVLSQAKQKSE